MMNFKVLAVTKQILTVSGDACAKPNLIGKIA